ncbi:MAG: NifU family protein [Patescibacteria group bacterium]|jgi:Fe-S cluster biogenesis protein NfuA
MIKNKVAKKVRTKTGSKLPTSDFKKYVQAALAVARPSLQAHGGNIKLVSVDEKKGLVKVKLQGMCVGCSMAQVTLQQGIENFLKEKVKGVKKVEGV